MRCWEIFFLSFVSGNRSNHILRILNSKYKTAFFEAVFLFIEVSCLKFPNLGDLLLTQSQETVPAGFCHNQFELKEIANGKIFVYQLDFTDDDIPCNHSLYTEGN